MKTIAVVSPKGGVSKSTLTVHQAACAKRRGDDAMLLDTDVQMSTCEWDGAGNGLDFPVVGCVRPQVEKFVASLALPRDYLYIDTAGIPVSNQATIAAVRLADLVLIPVTPSALDMWSMGALVEMVHARIAITGGALKAVFVITQATHRSRLARSVREALLETGLPVLNTVMTRRKSYAEAAASGCTVFDLADMTARAEMLDIAAEVEAILAPVAMPRPVFVAAA
ncbi:AAA family ATPase [Robbsia sp. Bb-Pol-6]|uniref:AAA family ATPase n=1 Tax=Robbsia betulipollinis TaxID=2981849 RepID=A0ABT3ZNT1_9BURK|nr:ParA family partition ATPase [Robbsia betulipollinis]MCY0387915.1 AAA family ATPase [Robbsia betulipollinis]